MCAVWFVDEAFFAHVVNMLLCCGNGFKAEMDSDLGIGRALVMLLKKPLEIVQDFDLLDGWGYHHPKV